MVWYSCFSWNDIVPSLDEVMKSQQCQSDSSEDVDVSRHCLVDSKGSLFWVSRTQHNFTALFPDNVLPAKCVSLNLADYYSLSALLLHRLLISLLSQIQLAPIGILKGILLLLQLLLPPSLPS